MDAVILDAWADPVLQALAARLRRDGPRGFSFDDHGRGIRELLVERLGRVPPSARFGVIQRVESFARGFVPGSAAAETLLAALDSITGGVPVPQQASDSGGFRTGRGRARKSALRPRKRMRVRPVHATF
jgi:hypothetical protein